MKNAVPTRGVFEYHEVRPQTVQSIEESCACACALNSLKDETSTIILTFKLLKLNLEVKLCRTAVLRNVEGASEAAISNVFIRLVPFFRPRKKSGIWLVLVTEPS